MAREKPDYRRNVGASTKHLPGACGAGNCGGSQAVKSRQANLAQRSHISSANDWQQVQHLNYGAGKVHELKRESYMNLRIIMDFTILVISVLLIVHIYRKW